MLKTSVDYTIFFRELSHLPQDITPLIKSFYKEHLSEELLESWTKWLQMWNVLTNVYEQKSREELCKQMKLTNPKYSLREWFLVPAYTQATKGDYSLIKELQEVMNEPYAEQSQDIEEKYYRLKPSQFFEVAGISHISCSS
jgi:uncharacterized protein YdiU (UPF0061 family)